MLVPQPRSASLPFEARLRWICRWLVKDPLRQQRSAISAVLLNLQCQIVIGSEALGFGMNPY